MWSHYSKNHHGICLEFAVEENNFFGRAGKVEYFTEYPKFQLHEVGRDNTVEMAFFSKARPWEYEQEFRILAAIPNRPMPLPNSLPIVRDDKFGFSKSDLKSIICGCEMTKEDCRNVARLAASQGLPALKMRRSPSRYELEISATPLKF